MAVDIPREIALKTLVDIHENGAYSNIALSKHLGRAGLRSLDRAFITELVYGVTKWRLTLDYYIEKFSSMKLKKISPWILNILRLGIYQLLFLDHVPPSAAVNESVKLSKKYGHVAAAGFVNAVLRNMAKQGKEDSLPEKAKDLAAYLSVKYSHPVWMIKNWLDRFGEPFTESLLEANNAVPDITIRINELKTSRGKLKELFKEAHIETELCKYVDFGVVVKGSSGVTGMPGYQQGYYQVQGESSMLVGKVLDPKPGETVLDVCAAPGGKSSHIGEMMKNQGKVIARDIHPHKLQLIENTAKRLGLTNIQTQVFDATCQDESLAGKADRVLVDAPCSGLGIIRKKPDIKWTRNEEDQKEIVGLQKRILDRAGSYVKPGGTLVYSTCTIQEEENQGVIEYFLSTHSDFSPTDLRPLLPSALHKDTAPSGYIQLFPNVDGVDGFFISRFSKKK